VVLVNPLGVVGLDLDCLLKRSDADELLPGADCVIRS
jgi:hypothetical protein